MTPDFGFGNAAVSGAARALAVACGAGLAVFIAFRSPRGRLTHHYELFVAAPPQTVWDTYFIHIKKADYRPGTRVLDAQILAEKPLTVRLTLQFDLSPQPRRVVLIYDRFEPYSRYRVHGAGSQMVEEGEFLPENGGTRLRIDVTGPMRGFILPWLARRRVERNQRALKAVCEGRPPPPQRGPLPQMGAWEGWAVLLLLTSLLLPLPWQARLVLATAAFGAGARYLRWLLRFARRL